MGRARLAGAVAIAVVAMAAVPGSAAAIAPRDCSLYATAGAAPGGDGTADHPFGTAQDLVNAVGPGQTGCLSPGTFTENLVISRSAPADQPITITARDPANRAIVRGSPGSALPATIRFDNAANVRLDGFIVRGARAQVPSPAVVIAGAGNALVGMEVSNEGNSTCVSVGLNGSARAANTLIEGIFLHTCGVAINDNNGISVGYATDTVIADSTIIGSPARGVQLYPEAQRTTVRDNVIDGSSDGKGDGMGVQFAGEGNPSSGNVVERNILSNNESYAVGYYWGGPPGTGNVARDNCVFSTRGAEGEYAMSGGQPVGYSIESSRSADPLFTDRNNPPVGFALRQGTPCGESGGGSPHGPLPTPVATEPEVLVSPESDPVMSAQLKTEVNSHLQAGSATLALTGGPVTNPGDVPIFPSFVSTEYGAEAKGLEPDTNYAYQVIARNNAGSRTSAARTFRTPPAPTLTPAVPQLSFSKPKVTKKGVQIKNLRIKARGSDVVEAAIQCRGKTVRCPDRFLPVDSRGLNIRLSPLLRPGASLSIAVRVRGGDEVQSPSYVGRVTRFSAVRRRKAGIRSVRLDTCIQAPPAEAVQPVTPFTGTSPAAVPLPVSLLLGKQSPCLRVPYVWVGDRGAVRFTSLVARAVPAGSSVRVTCRGKGCPKLPACRTLVKRKTVSLLLSGKARRRFPRTARLTVQITKPDTRGLVSEFRFTRTGPRQTYRFAPASTQARNCPTDL